MLGHSQDIIQETSTILSHLEHFSLLFWGSGMPAAVGISCSGSSQAKPKEEGPRRRSGLLLRSVASLTLASARQPSTGMDFVSTSGI